MCASRRAAFQLYRAGLGCVAGIKPGPARSTKRAGPPSRMARLVDARVGDNAARQGGRFSGWLSVAATSNDLFDQKQTQIDWGLEQQGLQDPTDVRGWPEV